MSGVKFLVTLSLLSAAAVVGAQVHHVVGGDRGWDPSSDVDSWSSGRIFRVGDKIWFAYSAAQENLVELNSKEEYEACDVSNPIRMYTEGLDRITLDKEGIRYFTSGKPESCKNGLKLPVEVQPQPKQKDHQTIIVAASGRNAFRKAEPPTTPTPSASTDLGQFNIALFAGLLFCVLRL